MRPAVLVFLIALAACTQDPTIEALSRLSATVDEQGPYVVEAAISGVQSEDRIELVHAVDDGEASIVVMDERSDGVFAAGMPGQPAGSRIYYYVVVMRDGDRVAVAPSGGALAPRFLDILE